VAAAAQIERRIFFKFVVPVVCPCTLRAKWLSGAKNGGKVGFLITEYYKM